MIISHEHKFLFLAPPKVGSMSIRKGLMQYSSIDPYKFHTDPSNVYYHEWHMNAKNAKKHFDVRGWDWNSYFKFSFVRNPWDRIISWRNYQILYVHEFEQSGAREAVYYPEYKELGKLSLKDWIAQAHLEPFVDSCMCFSNDNSLDFIGRFENLQGDFNIACDEIGIPRQELAHHNKSAHKHYTEYYDDETKQIIAERFVKDIEYFNYKFGE